MIFAAIQINGVCADAIASRKIPAGIVGAQVRLVFDERWNGLIKTAVFRAVREDCIITKDVIVSEDVILIPPETTAKPCKQLSVGIYGISNDGSMAIPTLWADLGRVYYAADPSGDESSDTTLPVWAQLTAQLERLGSAKLITEVQTQDGAAAGEEGGAAHKLTILYTDDTKTVIEWRDGYNGKDGKSAYAYAAAAGYTGSEEDFAEKLVEKAVLCTPQVLTNAQKRQVRENIGALSDSVGGLLEVTSADDGKFLRVINGLWAAAAVNYAEEASF